MAIVMAIAGLVILIFAGDWLVKGAVNLSLRAGIPALIVSLTVVAFGTSAPELVIGIGAVLDDVPGIALGNVVGSNTANVLLVLGIPAIISGLAMGGQETRKNYVVMVMATVLFIFLAFFGPFVWWNGLILLGALVLILGDQIRESMIYRETHKPAEDVEGADPGMAWWKIAMFLVLGIVGLPIGAQLLINGARQIAESFGVSDAVIGLTLVAIGTSLPELATTISAALRKQADVALGNVLGSNMFNLLFIIGITALVGPIPVEQSFLQLDLWVMLASSLLIAPFIFLNWELNRIWGVVFCALYAGYMVIVVG